VSDYGASKLLGERALREEAGDLPFTIVRPPVVYGPRDRQIRRIVDLVARGVVPSFTAEKYCSLVHVRDLTRGILAAAASPAAAGRVYHLADSRAWSVRHLLHRIAVGLAVRPRRVPLPGGLLRLLARPVDVVASVLGADVPPARDKVREILADHWIADTGRALRDLSFSTRIPLSEGLEEMLGAFRT
jgi:nucleoside-diphosphate-sugar epimerase